jgi:hypothetical protein
VRRDAEQLSGRRARALGHADEVWEHKVEDLQAGIEDLVEKHERDRICEQREARECVRRRREQDRVGHGKRERLACVYRARREAEGELEGSIMRGQVCGVRGTSRALRGAVPLRGRELGSGSEAARRAGEGAASTGRGQDEGKGDGREFDVLGCARCVGCTARRSTVSTGRRRGGVW